MSNIHLVLAFLVFAMFVATAASLDNSAFREGYYSIELKNNAGEISFQNLQFMPEMRNIPRVAGNYKLQVLSESGEILFENGFNFITRLFPEPSEGCFTPDGGLICNLDPIDFSESTEIVYLSALPHGRKTRILDDTGSTKLEFDLSRPPFKFLQQEEVYSESGGFSRLAEKWINAEIALQPIFYYIGFFPAISHSQPN